MVDDLVLSNGGLSYFVTMLCRFKVDVFNKVQVNLAAVCGGKPVLFPLLKASCVQRNGAVLSTWGVFITITCYSHLCAISIGK